MLESNSSYLVPVESITVEQEIKRSRFIAAIGRAVDKKKANEFINRIKTLYPDARHHCYAFVAGCPANTSDIGMSDDGEPQGTAGKPMLSILQYSKIGEIVVVVTRYFGGTKLGTGGLVRAYSSSVQLALLKIKLEEFVKLRIVRISFPYSYESSIRYVFEKMNVGIKKIDYGDNVIMNIEFPEKVSDKLFREIKNQTRGESEIFY
jgi:uncharacterized YigZ family protein